MKKVKFFCAALLILALGLGVCLASELGVCKAHLLNLANSAAIWANDHHGKYPSAQDFLSSEFMQYVKKVGGSAEDFYCPVTEKGLKYEIRSDLKYFAVKVPNPEKYGLSDFYFSTKSGLVITR